MQELFHMDHNQLFKKRIQELFCIKASGPITSSLQSCIHTRTVPSINPR